MLDFIKKLSHQVIYYLRCYKLMWNIKAVITDISLKNIDHKAVTHNPTKKMKDI